MAESKNCIVSFANSNGRYIQNLARLGESLRNNFDGDFLGFIGEKSVGSPLHSENPYAFKLYVIKAVLKQARYDKVLYLDSSCFAVKNVQPLFNEIEKDGFLFQIAGHKVGTWTNDFSLNYFGVTRDDAMEMEMIGNAGMLGIDFSKKKGHRFFDKWFAAMEAGCFKGAWTNDNKTESEDERCNGARHDMSASSIIINQMGLIHLAKKFDEWLQYAGVFDETINDTIIIKAQG